MAEDFAALKTEIRACTVCEPDLPRGARPIIRGAATSRILVVGQAPGVLAHESATPFNDPSGRRLRAWMGVSDAEFYDEARVAIAPMGFCYPGQDARGGDRPPRPECAPLWQARVRAALPALELTVLVGAHAQRFHLGRRARRTLTETVLHWRECWPEFIALPHPSWRNNAWLKRNPWFEADVLPALHSRVRSILERAE
ncbi:uracil-DNA glycosylase [Marinicauda salina]|uniref:Uracil-DNA glycosylase n=1 Tax=Marinicauda salina TaxID=2135793 RepID=A0A2U2BSV1_9PROT|nr:uracil-DNA glycosylase family protein [Marinicauda salina]PWE17084.1 uracil-DNA glycosylase [Marinicauda salina]